MHLMRFKLLFFALSTLVILPGLFFLLTSGLKLGIDFTGGSRLTLLFPKAVQEQTVGKVRTVFNDEKIEVDRVVSVTCRGDSGPKEI